MIRIAIRIASPRAPLLSARLFLGLDDQVEVIRLDGILNEAEAEPLFAAAEGGAHHLDALLGAEARDPGDAHRQVERYPVVDPGPAHVRRAGLAPAGLRPAPLRAPPQVRKTRLV